MKAGMWRLGIARFDGVNAHVEIDGRHFSLGEKYTLIERCLTAICSLDSSAEEYRKTSLRGLVSHPGLFISTGLSEESRVTDDPVLVAIAYQAWWTNNGKAFLKVGDIRIPSASSAENILRHREILNDHNSRFRGLLAGECEKILKPSR